MQVTRILAVRHGETAWNRDTRIQGHTDIALNAHGQWQAAAAGPGAERRGHCGLLRQRSEPGQRHRAGRGRSPPACRLHTHLGLRERCFGEFEGRTWIELEAAHPDETLAWRKRVPDFAPPGGESLLQLQARVVGRGDRNSRRSTRANRC